MVAALIVVGVIVLAVIVGRWAEETTSNPDLTTMVDLLNSGRIARVEINTWQPWSEAAVNRSLAAGQPVFVDFTASWCLSCQVNERVALRRPEVEQAFQARNVVLMKADWTRHDEAITQALTALGRSGVPAYALYVPGESEPEVLPEVLTPGIVIDALGKLPSSASTTRR